MGQIIKNVQPVKLFIGMLSSLAIFDEVKKNLIEKFGTIDYEGPEWEFTFTCYYNKEMGTPLKRKFIAFQSLIDPQSLVATKVYTNELEAQFAKRYTLPMRPINLDPGYLSSSKVVLATTKDYSHRIYLGDGIYAEITLRYYHKAFRPWEWTYPDYKSIDYLNWFGKLLEIYRLQL